MNTITWKRVKGSIPNLYVAYNDAGEAIGMIDKPVDTRTDKNFWRMNLGIGYAARFLGHSASRKAAMNHVHFAYEMSNATVAIV